MLQRAAAINTQPLRLSSASSSASSASSSLLSSFRLSRASFTTTTTSSSSKSSTTQSQSESESQSQSRSIIEQTEINNEYSKAALTARLSNYAYKQNLEELLEEDGYRLVFEKYTECTRVFVCDRAVLIRDSRDNENDDDGDDIGAKTVYIERTVVARGAVWGDDQKVNRAKLSQQISKVWPTSEVIPNVICHTGVLEMVEDFWNELVPYLTKDLPKECKKITYCGHSLGGSMAVLLACLAKLRLGIPDDIETSVHTYGSPNILALDQTALMKMKKENNDDDNIKYPNSALEAIGFEESVLRAHVLSNDIVPRMWLSHDPIFNTLKSNEFGNLFLKWKEETFGAGMITSNRFLYDVSGMLVFLELGNNDEARRAVVKETVCLETHLDRLTIKLEDFSNEFGSNPLKALAPALDHNSQNYVDAMQYIAISSLLVVRNNNNNNSARNIR